MTWLALWSLLKRVPWRTWALLAFLVAIVGAQLYLRHKWISEGRAEYRSKLEQCQAIASELNAAVKAQNAENAKRIAEAKKQQERAAQAERVANRAAERLVAKVADIHHQLEQAKRDPACKELLETKTCIALR